MTYGEYLAQQIDVQVVATSDEDGMRRHLGASVIGKQCLREVWYSFHWAAREAFEGRMLRLFARGHREEDEMVKLLRSVGATVWTHDDNGNQFRVSWLGGHFGGSCDGVAINLPGIPNPEVPTLLEIKTHNDKRFKEVKAKGLRTAQPKHWKQGQVYMAGLKLARCLYCAVNKNDDSLYFELFDFDLSAAQHLKNRGETVIYGEGIPPRINESPSWFECQFCPAKPVCHHHQAPFRNCRTCIYSQAVPGGGWRCELDKPEIQTQPKIGCDHYEISPNFS